MPLMGIVTISRQLFSDEEGNESVALGSLRGSLFPVEYVSADQVMLRLGSGHRLTLHYTEVRLGIAGEFWPRQSFS